VVLVNLLIINSMALVNLLIIRRQLWQIKDGCRQSRDDRKNHNKHPILTADIEIFGSQKIA
jgi:hypothetical protein